MQYHTKGEFQPVSSGHEYQSEKTENDNLSPIAEEPSPEGETIISREEEKKEKEKEEGEEKAHVPSVHANSDEATEPEDRTPAQASSSTWDASRSAPPMLWFSSGTVC